MRVPKYFFGEDEEYCYAIKHFDIQLVESREDFIILKEAVITKGNGFYFCKEFGEVGEAGDGQCGKICKEYKPRNGKNGRCVNSHNTYEVGDRKFKFSIEFDMKKKKRKRILELI